ncbi:MAG: polysaccharide deacetylase family protein [Candidatus Aphodosoma sp.]
MFSIVIVACVLVLLFLIWASADIRSEVYIRSLCKVNCKEKQVAITFDDGPSENTLKVLEVLKKYNAKATFFLVGDNIKANVDYVRSIVKNGHSVGNHSWSHSSLLPIRSVDVIEKELLDTNEALSDITNSENLLFRPPFGVTNPLIARALMKTHLVSIGWSVRSFDTLSHISRKIIRNRVVRQTRPGAIILLHDRVRNADLLLDLILSDLSSLGYKFTTVEELMKLDIYEK